MSDPFAKIRDRLAGANLQVYATTWCFDCLRLKRFLDKHDVPYEIVNINDVEGAAEKLEAATGKRGVPYMLVGKHWVRGYHLDQPGRFNPDLFVAELAAAL